MQKNKLKLVMITAAAIALSACGTLSNVSKDGTTDKPVWPKSEQSYSFHSDNATQRGSWPNWNNVRQIETGMSKVQIYNLIGRPHHSEGFDVREFDYLFHYRDNAGVHKTCQYKVLFDKKGNVGDTFFNPVGCGGLSQAQTPAREVIIREVVHTPAQIRE